MFVEGIPLKRLKQTKIDNSHIRTGCYKKSFLTKMSMNFVLLKKDKLPTIVGISIIISRKNSILGISEPEKKLNFLIFAYL